MNKLDQAWLEKSYDHHIIQCDDLSYPSLLREIHQPPSMLYIKGNLALLQQPQLAMVGTRQPTAEGRRAAYTFARELTTSGLTITSGLAIGIDTACHQGALAAGSTIAVLGSGLNCVYPRSNQKLAEQIIAANGCLISEFSPDTPPRTYHFPRRNRIISGLSLGVFVIEATQHSGSLITARHSLEQNRDIFALPSSPLNPQAKGCHQLIKEGAILVDSLSDILTHLNLNLAFSAQNMLGSFSESTQK